MKIHTTTMLVMTAFLTSSCANNTEAFAIQEFFALGEDCATTATDTILPGAVVDVAAGSPQVFVGARIANLLGATGAPDLTLKTGEVLELKGRNKPIVTQQVITYRLSKRIGSTPKPFITNRTQAFNDQGEIIVAVQLLSQDFASQLFDGLTASSNFEDFVDVQADVEFKGEFSSTRSPFSTGTLTFPIRAFRSAPTACPAGQQFKRFLPKDPTDPTSLPDACKYVGQSNGGVTTPAPPSVCCVVGSAGC